MMNNTTTDGGDDAFMDVTVEQWMNHTKGEEAKVIVAIWCIIALSTFGVIFLLMYRWERKKQTEATVELVRLMQRFGELPPPPLATDEDAPPDDEPPLTTQ